MRRIAMNGLILFGIAVAGGAAAQGRTQDTGALIFFDWGKYEIQRDYVGTLDAIASEALHQPTAIVSVAGYSDRAGSDLANRHSSLSRAQAVRDYLIDKGVPARAIKVTAFGEEQPLVATADGVREPQNRRVEVRLGVSPGR